VKQIAHFRDKPIDVDGLRRERLTARKRKQPLGQRRRPFGALLRIVNGAAGSREPS
jgi:hypothetical protein